MVDADHTWRFDAPDEMSAANTIEEVVGFDDALAMTPRLSLTNDSIESVESVDVYPSTGLVIAGESVANNKRDILLPAVATIAQLYTVVVTFVGVASGTRIRRGFINIQSTTGT